MEPSDEVRQLLDNVDSSRVALDEAGLPDRIRATGGTQPGDEAEWLAFMLHEGRDSPWGIHFCPQATGTRDDGTLVTIPSIEPVTDKMVSYWAERSGTATHPVLVARYAGLAWEFQHYLSDLRPDPAVARVRIEAAIDVAREELHTHCISTWTLLEHALSLATKMKDVARINAVKDAALDFEDRVAHDRKPGTWGAFDMLYRRKKLRLPKPDEQRLIDALEARLDRLSKPAEGNPDPWSSEAAALRLAKHYRRLEQPEDVERVLIAVEAAFVPFLKKADGVLAHGWLSGLHENYEAFGLRGHAQRLRQSMHELGPKVNEGMAAITATIEVTDDELAEFLDALLAGGREAAVGRILGHFVPSRADALKSLKQMRQNAPLVALLSHQLMDQHGRRVATVGSTEADTEGRVVMATAQAIQFSAPFLRNVLREAVVRGVIDPEWVMAMARDSLCFDSESMGLVERGIEAYFADDPIVSVHLLVPQCEAGIRRLADAIGVAPTRPNRAGGFDRRLLDELLRDEKLVDALPADMAHYLRVLLTDRRGVNLRNLVCHGMVQTAGFHSTWADRVFHVALFLANVRAAAVQGETGSMMRQDYVEARLREQAEGQVLLDRLWAERMEWWGEMLKEYPALKGFYLALENRGDVDAAIDTGALQQLLEGGHARVLSEHITTAKLKSAVTAVAVEWIARGGLDVKTDEEGVKRTVDAFHRVAMRFQIKPDEGVIDTEFFYFAPDEEGARRDVEDMEKLHIVWGLVEGEDGDLHRELRYLGIGTNEPYDLSTKSDEAAIRGRSRFFIWDKARGVQLEHPVERQTVGVFSWSWETIPRILLPKAVAVSFLVFPDGGRLCLSDPEVVQAGSDLTIDVAARLYATTRSGDDTVTSFQELPPDEQEDLRSAFSVEVAIVSNGNFGELGPEPAIDEVLRHAERDYVPYFFAHHAAGVSKRLPDDLVKNIRSLPPWRRGQYESILAQRLEDVFVMEPEDEAAGEVLVRDALFDASLVPRGLEGDLDELRERLGTELERDLYHICLGPHERFAPLLLVARLAMDEAWGNAYWKLLDQAEKALNGENVFGKIDLEVPEVT